MAKATKQTESAPNAPDLVAAAQWLPIADLRPNPRNPRMHGSEVEHLARTILRTAWGAPIVAQARGRRIIGGHGRLEAAKRIMRGVEVDGEMRGGAEHSFGGPVGCVPVRLVDVSDAEADAMTLADNARGLQGTDDSAAIVAMAASFGRESALMADMGFDAAALDRLVQSAGDAALEAGGGSDGNEERREIIGDAPQGEDPGADEPQPDAPVVSRAGDVYALGPHRLICGDSRDAATWARLMGSTKANIVFTSPPYADRREYDAASGFTPISPDGYVAWWEPLQACVAANIAADGSFFVNIKASVAPDGLSTELYVLDLVIAHARMWGWVLATEFCWKRTGVPKSVTRRFKNQFEPVYQFARGPWKMRPEAVMHPSDVVPVSGGMGSGDTDWSGRGVSALAQGVSGSVFGDARAREPGMAYPGNMLPTFNGTHESTGHTAAFPVGLPEFFIKAFSDAGDLVVDPFIGSGSTLIAAAKTGRVARGFEISPRYCDVIRRRWTKYARSAGIDPGPGALDPCPAP